MKKILYTLITTLLLISCHDDEMISKVPSSKDEGKLVELKVSLHIPDMQKSNSRAFGEGSLDYFENCRLQMVVFDGNGYLGPVGLVVVLVVEVVVVVVVLSTFFTSTRYGAVTTNEAPLSIALQPGLYS